MIPAKDVFEVLHEADHDVVESSMIDEVCWAELFRPEYVWADCYCNVVGIHFVVLFLFNYGFAEEYYELKCVEIDLGKIEN